MFDKTLQEYMFQPSIIITIIFGLIAVIGIAVAISLFVPNIVKLMIPKPKATRLGDHIKFKSMDKDKKTIVGDDGLLSVVLSVKGTDLKFNEVSTQQILAQNRQIWIETMIEMGIRTRIYLIRDKLPKADSYQHNFGIMEKVSQTWASELPTALSTEYYIVLSYNAKTKAAQVLEEAIEQTKTILEAYTVTELVDELEVPNSVEDGIDLDEIRYDKLTPAAFFGRMLSPVSRPIPFTKGLKSDLSYAITTDNMRYDSDLGMFEFAHGNEKKYAATLIIEEWPTPMTEMFMLEALSNPIEMTICHDVKPLGKAASMATLAWQSKMAPGLQPGSDSLEQYQTVASALEPGSEEEQALANVQTMITIYGKTPEEVIKGRNAINQLKSIGITTIWPKHTMVQHWFSHFPGFDAQSRPQRILSGEITLLSTFQHNPSGELNSDWGQGPIAMFETIDGAPYSFQFHAGGGSPPLGHCVSIGPSGSGKAQPLSAKIMTPTGWSTMGDMHVGKIICTPDGKVATVNGVFPQGELMSYEIEFEDGRKTECCDEHLWKIWNEDKCYYEVKKLSEIRSLIESDSKNIAIPFIDFNAVEYPAADHIVPAYNMGETISDNKDDMDISYLDIYKTVSVEQRLDLIRGMLDNYSIIKNGYVYYTTKNEGLAEDFIDIIRSVGGMAENYKNFTHKIPEYNVKISHNNLSILFNSSIKIMECLKYENKLNLNIKNIRAVGMKEMQCISIDNEDKLYITDDYIVTHNTTLITFLASMALRHENLKAFFFDRGRGCEVVTKSLNGSYLFFDGDEKNVSLNPLQIDDNAENRLFMREWLQLIGDVKADDHEHRSEIADAVDLIFDPAIVKSSRNLKKLYNTMFPAGSELRNRFLAWTNANEYGAIVCAENDALDISQRLGGFDFTNILDDEKLGPAMVAYLMHRILVEAKGDPRLIFIDETEPLLNNQNFQRRFRKLLQEGRKERQVIISCFQRPGAPEKLGLGDVIRGQCPTVFFFRNPAADEADYQDWGLTKRELDFVMGRSYKKKRYAVLLKRYTENGESVILNTDLANLGKYMNIYHSGRTQVQKMERMQLEHGENFLAHYLK